MTTSALGSARRIALAGGAQQAHVAGGVGLAVPVDRGGWARSRPARRGWAASAGRGARATGTRRGRSGGPGCGRSRPSPAGRAAGRPGSRRPLAAAGVEARRVEEDREDLDARARSVGDEGVEVVEAVLAARQSRPATSRTSGAGAARPPPPRGAGAPGARAAARERLLADQAREVSGERRVAVHPASTPPASPCPRRRRSRRRRSPARVRAHPPPCATRRSPVRAEGQQAASTGARRTARQRGRRPATRRSPTASTPPAPERRRSRPGRCPGRCRSRRSARRARSAAVTFTPRRSRYPAACVDGTGSGNGSYSPCAGALAGRATHMSRARTIGDLGIGCQQSTHGAPGGRACSRTRFRRSRSACWPLRRRSRRRAARRRRSPFAALVLAPGLALAALLPVAVRRAPARRAGGGPGARLRGDERRPDHRLAASASPSTRGRPHLLVLALCLAGLAAATTWSARRPAAWEAGGTGRARSRSRRRSGARVSATSPSPATTGRSTLLYADEIRRHGALLIDNPFWMLGVPFREDPGVPAVYGAFLAMSGGPAARSSTGSGLFALIGDPGRVRARPRVLGSPPRLSWRRRCARRCRLNQDILGWHGARERRRDRAAAAAARLRLALLPRRPRAPARPWAPALMLVGLAAAHRLTATRRAIAIAAALAVAVAAGGPARRRRRDPARAPAPSALAASCSAPGSSTTSSSASARSAARRATSAYLRPKVDLDLARARPHHPSSPSAAIAALVFAVRATRRDRGLWPLVVAARRRRSRSPTRGSSTSRCPTCGWRTSCRSRWCR